MRPAFARLAPLAAALACLAVSSGVRADGDDPAPSVAPRRWRRPPPMPAARFELVGDDARALPTFVHEGRRFVLGATGERYRVRVVNPTAERIEAVVSVDGLDALDGRPASLEKRGYVIPAFGEAIVDGWRTSMDTVAAFRFADVDDSYAARTTGARDVGVIGVAFFRERPPVQWRTAPVAPSTRARGGGAGAAPSPPAPKSEASDRAGLGTQFGETHDSRVRETAFVRADARPMFLSELRYDDREGLRAMGVPVDPPSRAREAELRRTAEAFPRRFAEPPR